MVNKNFNFIINILYYIIRYIHMFKIMRRRF